MLLFFFIFNLYNIVLVLPNIEMNPPHVYMCSPSWTLLPPPSPYHPSGSSQCTSPKHPVSCIEPGLVTRFIHDSMHVSIELQMHIILCNMIQTHIFNFIHVCQSIVIYTHKIHNCIIIKKISNNIFKIQTALTWLNIFPF